MDGEIHSSRMELGILSWEVNRHGEELKQLESTIKEEGLFVLSGVLSCQ